MRFHATFVVITTSMCLSAVSCRLAPGDDLPTGQAGAEAFALKARYEYEQQAADQTASQSATTQPVDNNPSAATRPSMMDAAPAVTEKSALGDYMAYAAYHNPGLEAAFNRWKAALERIPQQKALPDPQFTFRWFVVEQAMRDGNMRYTYEISQAFPWLPKLALRGDIAAQEAVTEFHNFQAAQVKLFNAVRQSYYESCYITRAAAVTEASLEQLKYIETIARKRYETAAASQPDVIRAQVEVGKLQNDLASLKDMQAPTLAKLAAALNWDRLGPKPLPAPRLLPDEKTVAEEKQLLERLTDANPELRAMESDIKKLTSAVALARQDYYPDFMIGFEFDQMVSAPDVMGGDMKNPMALMFSLNLPIWRDKYAAGVREAQRLRFAAQLDRQDKANSLSADLKMALYNCRNAERKIELYRDTLIPRATQSLKSTQAGYQTGGMSFSDLIDSHRILLDFELSLQRATTDRLQSLSEIEAIVGGTR